MARRITDRTDLLLMVESNPVPGDAAPQHRIGHVWVRIVARSGSSIHGFDSVSDSWDARWRLDDLRIGCQIDDTASLAQLYYAERAGYHAASYEYSPVGLDLMRAQVRTLEAITRSFERMTRRFGPPRSFGQFVTYHLAGFPLQGCLRRGPRSGHVAPAMPAGTDIARTIDDEVRRVALVCRAAAGHRGPIPAAA